jgi:ferredoxin
VVRIKNSAKNKLVPACATIASEGMIVESQSAEVIQARRTALELLFSDHLGDCIGPCQNACPLNFEIPAMLHSLARNDLAQASGRLFADIPLAGTASFLCPGFCEKACRRRQVDQSVSIIDLKKFLCTQYQVQERLALLPIFKQAQLQQHVALTGSCYFTLTASAYLQRAGVQTTVFLDEEFPAEMQAAKAQGLPPEIAQADLAFISALGGQFITDPPDLDNLGSKYDSVLTGPPVLTDQGQAVKTMAAAKLQALNYLAQLEGQSPAVNLRPFSVFMGKLKPAELDLLLGRVNSAQESPDPTNLDSASKAADRCLHCDCRKPQACLLRKHGSDLQVKKTRFKGQTRDLLLENSKQLIYEPGKCISCGICITVCREYQEELGLTYIGRGFDVRIGMPLGESLEKLEKCAQICAQKCPTGALVASDNFQ